jgi:hypothetical protein
MKRSTGMIPDRLVLPGVEIEERYLLDGLKDGAKMLMRWCWRDIEEPKKFNW